MPVPADCYIIGTGISPEGTDGCIFFIRASVIDKVQQNGPRWKFFALRLILAAVQSPTAIYEGLGREGCDGVCCYCAKPPEYSTNEGKSVPVEENVFFMVYAEPASGGLIVWDWGWRPEDENAPGQPAGWETFGRRVWTKP
jgi:hypothetical protein